MSGAVWHKAEGEPGCSPPPRGLPSVVGIRKMNSGADHFPPQHLFQSSIKADKLA